MFNREMLAAIRAAPAEDAPRLVYADWLEEHGDPGHAKLIRVQCAQAAGTLKCKRRGRRCGRCVACHEETWAGIYVLSRGPHGWIGTTRDRPDLSDDRMVFRRGFPEVVRCFSGHWLKSGPGIVRENPVGRVVFWDKTPEPSQADGSRRRNPRRVVFRDGSVHSGPGRIPFEFWRIISSRYAKRGLLAWRAWDSPEGAVEDVSRAAILWAETEAGLVTAEAG